MKKADPKTIITWAQETLKTEAKAILNLQRSLNTDFINAVRLLAQAKGRVVVSGMGKAGIIAQKFSATLSSTGTPSFWIHPAEAAHGDLGRLAKDDIIFVLSYSGETDEIKRFLPFLKNIGIKIIAITGNIRSTLAQYASAVLDVTIHKEACPLGLAPTTSTTAMLALCDALSIVVQRLRGFKESDFALFHPAGSLGNRLLYKVSDLMRKGIHNPVADQNVKVKEALLAITQAKAGAVSIVDQNGKLVGIFTDGDLRRNIENKRNLLHERITAVMTKDPITVKDTMLAVHALKILKKYKIDEVPVVNSQHVLVGLLDLQDLVRVGIV